jgi:flagellar biosynthesis anti-sigma factor FlgM
MVDGIHQSVGLPVHVQQPERTTSVASNERLRSRETQELRHSYDQAAALSPQLQHYQRAVELVKQAPDVRHDRVDAVRRQVLSGHYSVPLNELADRIAAALARGQE